MKNIMNYKEFMKTIEEKLLIMSEKEKTIWIYNMARTVKEHERIKFLDSSEIRMNCFCTN